MDWFTYYKWNDWKNNMLVCWEMLVLVTICLGYHHGSRGWNTPRPITQKLLLPWWSSWFPVCGGAHDWIRTHSPGALQVLQDCGHSVIPWPPASLLSDFVQGGCNSHPCRCPLCPTTHWSLVTTSSHQVTSAHMHAHTQACRHTHPVHIYV